MLLSLVNAKLLPAGGEAVVIPLALAFGGGTQFVAGILEFRAGNTFGMTAFLSYGAFWIWFALLNVLGHTGVLDLSASGPTVGVALLLWGALTVGFWFCTFRFHLCLWLTFLGAAVVFALLGAGAALQAPSLSVAGGWMGVLTGIVAGYTGVATLINLVFAQDVAPLGPTLSPARALPRLAQDPSAETA
jgi:succinate-acetate transporter protein